MVTTANPTPDPTEALAVLSPITPADVRRAAAALAEPLDLAAPEAAGVIVKAGRWWHVPDWSALPEAARLRVCRVADGRRVKFEQLTPKDRAALERIAAG